MDPPRTLPPGPYLKPPSSRGWTSASLSHPDPHITYLFCEAYLLVFWSGPSLLVGIFSLFLPLLFSLKVWFCLLAMFSLDSSLNLLSPFNYNKNLFCTLGVVVSFSSYSFIIHLVLKPGSGINELPSMGFGLPKASFWFDSSK